MRPREVVQKAQESVKTSAVNEWFRKNIGKSVQARRVEVNRLIKIREEKLKHFRPVRVASSN